MNSDDKIPSFNLWTAPWITLEHREGGIERYSIEQALIRAHEFSSIYEQSPLVVVGIHRLLTAIAQAIVNPQRPPEINKLWAKGAFAAEAVEDFGHKYAGRFDLFSEDAPFMQSADTPLRPAKGDKAKTIGYLAMEMPAGTAITHYRHGGDESYQFCAACAAACMTSVPAFASSGGAGIKPSINGVPPIYIIPGGESLFKSLASSLILPDYQPEVRAKKQDDPVWLRQPTVKRNMELSDVGYLHSLTFLARRIRLHPKSSNNPCSRCGHTGEWYVSTMVFEMGESRPKESPFWFDPFAAYKLPDETNKNTKKKTVPTPLRPTEGKATWREFGTLFLQQPNQLGKKQQRTRRPGVIEQMAELDMVESVQTYPFRCIGLRTDMKAKIFEWTDAHFEVSPALLRNADAAAIVHESMHFASECEFITRTVFREFFGGDGKNSERHANLRLRMQNGYWSALAAPFRDYILKLGTTTNLEEERLAWLNQVVNEARQAFSIAATLVGDDAANLRQRVKGEQKCSARLFAKRKEYSNEPKA